ncbi:MAG: hypothetical protein HQK54_02730 [Oligoflexales bacterium]|nr:hypothetical protein [Oligoflexales bacterium]
MINSIPIILFLILITEAGFSAGGDILPKGNAILAPGEKYNPKAKKQKKEQESSANCPFAFRDSSPSESVLSRDGNTLFVLIRDKGDNKAGKNEKQALLMVDLISGKYIKRASMTLLKRTVMVSHGDPVYGISFMAFNNGANNYCLMGNAEGVGISFENKQKLAKTYPLSSYKVLYTPYGKVVADLKLGIIKLIDIVSLQSKVDAEFNKSEAPVYFDSINRTMITFGEKSFDVLKIYNKNFTSPIRQLKVSREYRIVQDNEQFLLLKPEKSGNSLSVNITEFGVNTDKSDRVDVWYNLKFPAKYRFDLINFKAIIDKNILIAHSNISVKESYLDRGAIYDYKTSAKISEIDIPQKQQVSEVIISSDRTEAVFLIRQQDTDDLLSIKIFTFSDSRWKDFPIDIKTLNKQH